MMAGESAESALKRIYRGDISAFVRRNQIIGEALSAISNPSWLLQVDRLLMKHGSLVVVAEESLVGGRSLQQLEKSLRKQDEDGLKIAGFIVELGVSALAELAS